MRITNLNAADIDSVIDLFCECFSEDHYYLQLLKDFEDKKGAMRTLFRDGIENCVNDGRSIGVEDHGKLVAFALLFDYKKTKQNSPREFYKIFGAEETDGDLPYSESIHKTIESIDGDVLYLLTLAVSEPYRRKGLASGLVDCILKHYSGYSIVSDVSNEYSLSIYCDRNFAVNTISDGYYFVVHNVNTPISSVDYSKPIELIIPSCDELVRLKIAYSVRNLDRYLFNCNISNSSGVKCFFSETNSICTGITVNIEYEELLKFQRFINLSQVQENTSGSLVYYTNDTEYACKPLLNNSLSEMLKTRSTEWSLIPDVFISIPVEYTNIQFIKDSALESESCSILKDMDFRTHYEAGVPSKMEMVDDLAGLKNRIKRYYLGKIKLQIFSEITLENYNHIGEPIGPAATVDIYVSIDNNSNCGVLTWYSLSCPFLTSHLFDTVIRNQLMVIDDGSYVNFYDYLQSKYGMIKRGTPKIFSVFPCDKNKLSKSQLASLLMAETIYPDGENFGEIIDDDILAVVNRKHGMGQYDRAVVYAYTNTILQFSKDYRGSISDRLYEESITLFYIELILFEEAAIHIADRSIINMFTTGESKDPVDFLSQVDAIYDCYSKTIDFWNIKVNYPSSQKSIAMLRNAFRIKEQLEEMNRNREQLQIAFDTKCDIIDRKDAKRMDTSLAIISVLAIFSAWIDGHDYIATWNDVLSLGTIHVLQRILFVLILVTAGYATMHLFRNRIGLFLKKRRSSIRKRKQKK